MTDGDRGPDGDDAPRAARGRRRRLPLAAAGLALGLALVTAVAIGTRPTGGRPPTARPGAGPAVAVTDLDGTRVRIPAGRPTVLYFMTTGGCAGCEAGAVALQAIHRQLGTSVAVLGVATAPGTPTEYVRAFGDALGLTFPLALDADGTIAARYGIDQVSVAVVLDAHGALVARGIDATDRTALRRAIRRARAATS